jgi:ribosome-associated protein
MPIEVQPGLVIRPDEYHFEYARASGPGGQHVNKVSTRATLCLDLGAASSLTEHQKRLIQSVLGGRISKLGILRVTSRRFRSRSANIRAAKARLAELLREALIIKPQRKPTRTTAGAKRRRLDTKRRRSQVKQLRQRPPSE